MEEEYDYSMYATLCTIKICSVSNVLEIHRVSNRISEASARYFPQKHLQIPLDFYYSKDSGSIIYGKQMIYHYKQYPPHEKYIHVANFVEDLYKLYQSSCEGGFLTQNGPALYSAITSFLTKIHRSQLSVDKQASTTQYAFILPSQKHTNRDFLNTTLRPLLQTTPWLTSTDSASKIVFYSKIDTYAYQLNKITNHNFCLKREMKYLFCTLQETNDHRRLMLTVNFIRAVYDPDLIAASGRSMTALGENVVLSSKLVSPPLLLEIPIETTLAKMYRLTVFLYNKVFASEEQEGSNSTLLEEYNTNSNHWSLIHRLIHSISTSNYRDLWSKKINSNDFGNRDFSNALNENMKSSLSCITYEDIMQFFDDVDVQSIKSEIGHYLQKHGDEEIFQSILILEQEYDHKLCMEIKPCKTHNLLFAENICQRFYLLQVKKAITCFLEQLKESKSTKVPDLYPWTTADGCAYKILKMVQLSNRLGRPIVMKSVGENEQKYNKTPVIQKEKLALIDQIQPYGYYVEANFSCSNEIKMYLNQIIETTAEDDKLQKSTMSILDSTWQTSDMYDFIFDSLWSIIDRHCANPQCKSLQENESINFDNYKVIRTDLIKAIKSSMENTSNAIQDLDEVIYHVRAESDCTCDILITHRLVMNTGLLSYLKCIAGEIVASLKTNAIFGNYKISCLLVTGEFLYKWLEQGNSTYGELIWNQLRKEINSALNDKQLRTYLMMKKSIILEDNNLNFKPLKLEKYRQIFSKQYYLKILPYGIKNFRVYQDKGDRCVEVPITKQEKNLIWEIPLLAIKSKGDLKCSLTEKFYIVFGSEDVDHFYCTIELLPLSLTDLNNIDSALSSKMNVALLSDLASHDSSIKALKDRITFPLEVKIMPCSYLSAIDLRLRMGIDASAYDPLEYNHVAYSERLTVQKI